MDVKVILELRVDFSPPGRLGHAVVILLNDRQTFLGFLIEGAFAVNRMVTLDNFSKYRRAVRVNLIVVAHKAKKRGAVKAPDSLFFQYVFRIVNPIFGCPVSEDVAIRFEAEC